MAIRTPKRGFWGRGGGGVSALRGHPFPNGLISSPISVEWARATKDSLDTVVSISQTSVDGEKHSKERIRTCQDMED